MKYIVILALLISLESFTQTPITDDNFHQAIFTCLSTNPVDGLCNSSEYGAMPDWDVSTVTDMSRAFSWNTNFNGDISEWDVSKVTNMEKMFELAYDFNQDIGEWDVGNVTNMFFMFGDADSFNQDIGNWTVSNVNDMHGMFWDAENFNQDLGNWDVSSVTNMRYMFGRAFNFSFNISGWDVSNVTIMEGMFFFSIFNHDISEWDVSSVTNMERMFNLAENFNQDIGDWCVEQIVEEPFEFGYGSPLLPEYYPKWGEECILGIINDQLNDILAYPNPTESTITVYIESENIKEINIYNQFNQRVFNTTSFSGEIEISELPAGFYIVEIITNEKRFRQKIIKK